jgi:metal-dependent amidase/aminoacylase/carboxypeptidase family protein
MSCSTRNASSAAGVERAAKFGALMAADDFSAYLRVAPGCFFFIGAGNDRAFPHHHPRFTIDDRALPVGIETFTKAALRLLTTDSNPNERSSELQGATGSNIEAPMAITRDAPH